MWCEYTSLNNYYLVELLRMLLILSNLLLQFSFLIKKNVAENVLHQVVVEFLTIIESDKTKWHINLQEFANYERFNKSHSTVKIHTT